MTATRTCISCRTASPQDDLLRVVLSPEGAPAVDFSRRLPGRGAYVCWSRSCLESSGKKGRLTRALKTTVGPLDEGWAVEAARSYLLRRIAEVCGLLQRSGAMRSGGHTSEMALAKGWGALGLVSQDAAEDSRDKHARRCKAAGLELHELPFSSEEFGRAVGKGARSVAVVGGGPLGLELERALQRYRGLL